jgi:3-hydroxyacyl-CoA dehydrogenase, NAD binding domain
MSFKKPIRRITIVGTGVIGASWAAQYLARGFDVVATDPAPNAEGNLRKYVDDAWKLLTIIGLTPGASRDRLSFAASMQEAVRIPTSFKRMLPRDRNSRLSSSPRWMMRLLLIRSSRRVHRG